MVSNSWMGFSKNICVVLITDFLWFLCRHFSENQLKCMSRDEVSRMEVLLVLNNMQLGIHQQGQQIAVGNSTVGL